MSFNSKINSTISLFFLLWATMIGPEIFSPARKANPNSAKPKSHAQKVNLPKDLSLKTKKHRLVNKIDQERFLKSFKRQSGPNLVECLKENYSENKLSIIGRLDKQGKITSLETPLNKNPLPECLFQQIQPMRFKPLTAHLKSVYVEISWQLDW